MTDYRSCPSFPGYSVSRDGAVRRDPWVKVTKTGRSITQPAVEIAHVGRDRAYVTLQGRFVRWDAMVADAWDGHVAEAEVRPRSLYPGGRILTLQEYWAWLRAQ